MKTFVGVAIVAACLVACTHGYPGAPRDSSDSDESNEKKSLDTVLVLPPEVKNRFVAPVLDFTDASDFEDSLEDNPWTMSVFRTNPFEGLLSNMENVMKRVREQIAGILSGISEQGVEAGSIIPEGANTTSTTKVINGHVVTVNETTYMDGTDDFSSLIRIRIIDVKPQNETIVQTENDADGELTTLSTVTGTGKSATDEDNTTASRSVETVEDFANEIPKNQVDTLTA